MKHYEYYTQGTCAVKIEFDIDDNDNIHNTVFTRGCNGNLKAISKLIEGKNRKEVAEILKGNKCGFRETSCADQLSKALFEVETK